MNEIVFKTIKTMVSIEKEALLVKEYYV